MFQDPLTAVMAMLLLCFMGILVMFLFFVRSLSSQAGEMRESFRKQQLSLADIERQLMDLNFALRKSQGGEAAPAESAPAVPAGPGLREGAAASENQGGGLMSMRQEDLMAMLEAAGQARSAPLRFDDQLLPPPSAPRPIAEEYDPAKDPHLFEDSLLSEPGYGSYHPRADKGRTAAPSRHGSTLSIKLDD